jgi:hypothetical protein
MVWPIMKSHHGRRGCEGKSMRAEELGCLEIGKWFYVIDLGTNQAEITFVSGVVIPGPTS